MLQFCAIPLFRFQPTQMEIFFENLESIYGFEMESSLSPFWCITLVPSMHQSRVEVEQVLRGVRRSSSGEKILSLQKKTKKSNIQ